MAHLLFSLLMDIDIYFDRFPFTLIKAPFTEKSVTGRLIYI